MNETIVRIKRLHPEFSLRESGLPTFNVGQAYSNNISERLATLFTNAFRKFETHPIKNKHIV